MQCANGEGACPDHMRTDGADNVEKLAAMKEDGIVTIRLQRPLETGNYLINSYHFRREEPR